MRSPTLLAAAALLLLTPAPLRAQSRNPDAYQVPRGDQPVDRSVVPTDAPIPEEKAAEPAPAPADDASAPGEEDAVAEDGEAEEKPEEADGNRTPGWFKKGDLASVGALGLVPWENRIGVRASIERLGPFFYLSAAPGFNYTTDVGQRELTMSFGVPLRFELLDTRGQTTEERFGNLFRFRTEDWDSVADYAKLIQIIKYGRKEDHFYVNANGFSTATIGHGTILRRYNPNLAIDAQRVSVSIDGFTDWFGAQTYVNNLLPDFERLAWDWGKTKKALPNVMGALLFFKPFSFIDRENYVLRSISFGLTGVTDLAAPMVNQLDVYDDDHDGRRGEIRLGGPNHQPQSITTTAWALGGDAEVKFYKSPDKTVDLKAYVDVSSLSGEIPKPCSEWQDAEQAQYCPTLFTDDPVTIARQPELIESERHWSVGGSLGVLGRFTLGDDRDHAIRVRLEGRTYEPDYLPSYFDSFYQVQRTQYATTEAPRAQNPANRTKIRRIMERRADGMVFGGYGEISYAYWENFEAALGLEMNNFSADNNFFVHVGVPRYEFVSFFVTYQKRTSALEDFIDFKRNSVLVVQARAFVLPFLFLHIEAITPFGFGTDNQLEQIFDINVGAEISFSY